MGEHDSTLLHILVVGFHHKKGSQVEYCYPNLPNNNCKEDAFLLPEAWKHLPTLAMPDGAHNYEKDNIYFIMPPLIENNPSVYGVACFRQMASDALCNKTPDITRSSVQKSVVVLSTLPLFGMIRLRLEAVTQAYFTHGDFSQTDILKETFHSLNSVINNKTLQTHIFTDLSVRDLVLRYRHHLLVLFKMLLLERRLIFFTTPVHGLTSVLLTLVSLLPEVLSSGLGHCTEMSPPSESLSLSTSLTSLDEENMKYESTNQQQANIDESTDTKASTEIGDEESLQKAASSMIKSNSRNSLDQPATDNSSSPSRTKPTSLFSSGKTTLTGNFSATANFFKSKLKSLGSNNSLSLLSPTNTAPSPPAHEENPDSPKSIKSNHSIKEEANKPATYPKSPFQTNSWGFPLAIFTKSFLFYPYTSLHNIGLLEDCQARAFLIGATNMLFKRRSNLVDAIIGSNDTALSIEGDPELKRAIQLTTADLRFIGSIVTLVEATQTQKDSAAESSEELIDKEPQGWEGSDNWIRQQFQQYLQALLVSTASGSSSCDDFNIHFVRSFGQSHAYLVWRGSVNLDDLIKTASPLSQDTAIDAVKTLDDDQIEEAPCISVCEHPGHRDWQLADFKLRMNHMLRGSEQGRKINTAMQQTGKVVSDTGKVVGGAFNHARSAVSSFWAGIARPVHTNNSGTVLLDNDHSKQNSGLAVHKLAVNCDNGES